MANPVKLSAVIDADRTWSHDADGETVTQEATCECGRVFTQRLLSERFLEIVARHSRTAMALFQTQVPGFWVPVHCPRCERIDISRGAHIASLRGEGTSV